MATNFAPVKRPPRVRPSSAVTTSHDVQLNQQFIDDRQSQCNVFDCTREVHVAPQGPPIKPRNWRRPRVGVGRTWYLHTAGPLPKRCGPRRHLIQSKHSVPDEKSLWVSFTWLRASMSSQGSMSPETSVDRRLIMLTDFAVLEHQENHQL